MLIQQMANLNTEYKTLESLKQQLEDRLSTSEQQMSKLKRDVMAMRGQLSNARKSQEKAEKQLRITKTAKQSNTKSMSADPDKLRRDLNVLAEAQFNSKRLISNQQDELERSKAANVLAEQRCEELVASKERELAEFRSAAEQLVADALERSSQATVQLQEAKQSYKLQLTRLELELNHERQSQMSMKLQSSLHKTELEQVRLMAHNQTKKAQQAMQVCRLTVAKLANQAEVDQSSSTDNVARLTTQLQIERNLASSTAQKYEQLKVSSAKRCRELAAEVTHLRSLHTSRDQINQ
ncbi:myosin-11-like [Corticium candelabrum]|uniref:myosin-11-like n=1 Tax=Corticium candelabrum TaxID=121492 RepID=UPI002E255418|nr:myosin-11-like [Corticium candelabrum]